MPRAEAVAYIREILERLFALDADAYVRLSANGGSPPHYCIEMVMDIETGEAMTLGHFSGKTHRELTEKQLLATRWHEAVTPRPEVQVLINELRQKAKRQP